MPLQKKSKRPDIRVTSEEIETESLQMSDSPQSVSRHPVYGEYRTPQHYPSQPYHEFQAHSFQDYRSESPHLDAPSWPMRPGFASTHSDFFHNSSGQSTPVRTGTPTPFLSQDTLRELLPERPAESYHRDWVKEGLIAREYKRDDKELFSGWKRNLYYYCTPILTVIALSLYWFYFGFRVYCVISAQSAYSGFFPLAWIFIIIEFSVAVPSLMHSIWSLFIFKKRTRAKLRLMGNDVPRIDAFITCCGEDDDLILDTVRAACDVDYPVDRFRVILLDDGKSDNLRKSCAIMRDNYPNLYYICRPKFPGVPHHFKAGNLNYGLEAVRDFEGGAAPFAAALDADMIPERHWLRSLMPHLLIDEKVGLACPPQLFYNVPAGDPLCQSLDFFVHVSEPIKDALGVAWCTGSGYICRRTALEEIGLFPKGSLAEDVATSTLMLGKGWKTAYIHEALQFGTVPEDYGSHLKQRTRWAIGTVDTSFKLKFCLYGDAVKHMTFAQRFSSFMYAVLSLNNIFVMLSLFALPLVLIINKPLVAYANDQQLRYLIYACFAQMLSNRLAELVLFLPSGYATGQRGNRSQLWMSPYIAITIIRSFCLPKWLGGQAQAFKPTGSLKSALNERDPKARAPIYRRLWVILMNFFASFHLSYVYFTLVAVVFSTWKAVLKLTIKQKLVALITHAWWPPLAWILVISAFWIPVSYACNPPDMPDREELLDRDPKTGIAHPTAQSKKIAFEPQTAWFEFETLFCNIFTTTVFVASFFY